MQSYRPLADPLLEVAQNRFGISYLFPYQRLVIGNVLEAVQANKDMAPDMATNDGASEEIPPTEELPKREVRHVGAQESTDIPRRQIVLLPTGAGKSLCFQLPALLLPGVTIVVFPLLSLIADQARRLDERRIANRVITGATPQAERHSLLRSAGAGDILLSNPETLLTPAVRRALRRLHCAHLVIDEAHCVTEWGDSFRPAYLGLGELCAEIDFAAITAFTATASPGVLRRLRQILFADQPVHLIAGNPDRENIRYSVRPTHSKMATLTQLLAGPPDGSASTVRKPAIIFCRSRTGSEQCAHLLRRRLGAGKVCFYHAGLAKDEKHHIEEWFLKAQDAILCATCAYGMGVDKQDIRTVIHRDLPSTVESYLQETGRAGRDRRHSEAILLVSDEDWQRRAQLSDEQALQRYDALLNYATLDRGCRRTYLLALLGGASEDCSGCDLCDKQAITVPPEEELLTKWLEQHPRRYSVTMAAHLLHGRPTAEAWQNRLWAHRGYGLFFGWAREDISELLTVLISRGQIIQHRRWPWKSYLSLRKADPISGP